MTPNAKATHDNGSYLLEDVINDVEMTKDGPINKVVRISNGTLPPVDYATMLEKVRVDLSVMKTAPPVAIEIQQTAFATLGNFSLLMGKAKSKKTFFLSLLIAASLGGELFMNSLQAFLNGKKILWFDSEQSPFDVQRVLRRVLDTAERATAPDLEVYGLRTYNTKERRELIEYAINNTENVGLVIIDGVRDLVCDINSAVEATEIATLLLKWTEERNIHIITVLHQNKGDINARGHVGTELVNKAESVLSITKDSNNPELSIVTPEYFRGKEFNPFAFSVDQRGLPYIVEDWKPNTKEAKQSSAPHTYPEPFHKERIKEAFSKSPRLKYKETWEALQTVWGPFKEMGNNRAMAMLSHCVINGWIRKIEKEESGERWALYCSNLPL